MIVLARLSRADEWGGAGFMLRDVYVWEHGCEPR